MPGFLQKRGWKPIEVALWLFALVLVILSVTKVVGSWALLIGIVISTVVAFLRYRAEREQRMRNAGNRDESVRDR